jgi:predicted oxidoreductase
MNKAMQTQMGGARYSRLVQGYWRLADWEMDAQQRLAFLQQHLELGISSVDHADIYGDYRCESLFGEALRLKPALREQLQIISKCGIQLVSENFPDRKVKHYDSSASHIFESVDNSLRALGTDRLDLLLLHRPDPLLDADATAQALLQLHQAGKVLAFGVSNHSPAQFELLQSRLRLPLVTNQVEINPLHSSALFDGTLDHLQQRGLPAMAWSPLAGGKLFSPQGIDALRLAGELRELSEETGLAPDQLLYAWVLRLPGQPLLLLGTGRIERVRAAVATLDAPMERETWFRILAAGRGSEVA